MAHEPVVHAVVIAALFVYSIPLELLVTPPTRRGIGKDLFMAFTVKEVGYTAPVPPLGADILILNVAAPTDAAE